MAKKLVDPVIWTDQYGSTATQYHSKTEEMSMCMRNQCAAFYLHFSIKGTTLFASL
jgi:hypothetical protein